MQDDFIIFLNCELKNTKTYLKYNIFTGKEIEPMVNSIVKHSELLRLRGQWFTFKEMQENI